jgi:NitT/TauT family transport system substrate-binding protein
MRIGHLSTFYHTAILLMARQDIAGALGDTPLWKLFGTGPAIMQAFALRELDLAYVGLPPAIIGLDQGIAVRCVAGGHMEGTVLAAGAQRRGFADGEELGSILGQFAGGAIGVPGRGSIHDVILQECLARFGLQDSITVINYPWADLVTEAFASGAVQAVIGTPALAVAVGRYVGGKVLYPPALLWPNNPSYGIVVSREYLDAERDVVRRFLALHEEASALLRSRPAVAARMIADHVGIIDPEFVLETLAISPKYCAQLTEDYLSSTMRFAEKLKELGYIRKEPTRGEIFDRTLIDEVHPEPDHYGSR